MRRSSKPWAVGDVLREGILAAIARGPLPLFIYDLGVVRERVTQAKALLDRYYYPVKACPIEDVVRAAVESGCGADLCSEGDLAIASAAGCARQWSFTSAHTSAPLMRRLANAASLFDADSEEQRRMWRATAGSDCGVRIAAGDDKSPYALKFGIPAAEIEGAVAGLHIHESHASRSPAEMADRIDTIIAAVDVRVLRQCAYLNIGGGWPILNGRPADCDAMGAALHDLREALKRRGFTGMLTGEPGEWVVGHAGHWAAVVSAVKGRVLVLDTATPVPCRPSAAPFLVLRDGRLVADEPANQYEIFGSANTGLDTIGSAVALPAVMVGDVIVASGQGAYVRSLIGSFNERPLPAAVVV